MHSKKESKLNPVKKLLILLIFCCYSFSEIHAQNDVKIGYINTDSLIPFIPGRDSVQTLIETLVQFYKSQLTSLGEKYKSLYYAYKKDSTSKTTDSVKAKIARLQALKKRIEDFKANAKENLRQQQNELMSPLIAKADKAIAEVAKEQGLLYVIDTSTTNGMVLIFAAKEGDILKPVKKKLGIY